MVRIRLRRNGLKGQASYRIIAADKESPRDGCFLEILSDSHRAERVVGDLQEGGAHIEALPAPAGQDEQGGDIGGQADHSHDEHAVGLDLVPRPRKKP